MKISVVTPIYNEENNIPLLFDELRPILAQIGHDYEIIAVNDGSKDGSLEALKKLALKDRKNKIIDFRVNRGQTAAIRAGIEHSTGDLVITIDSDLENDPHDIPKLISKINEGYDVVSGWREKRWKGSFFTRKIPSVIANWIVSKITKVKLHDYGCILKVYKRDVLKDLKLYGEMHRFIPAYASWQGAKVTEVKVSQRKRLHGKSHYGVSRTFRVILDLVLLKFLDRYMNRPIHFFGGLGFVSFLLGFLAGLVAIFLKIVHLRDFVSTPLPILSALFIIVGVELIAIGVIAEILMRTYYESQDKKPYVIKELVNF